MYISGIMIHNFTNFIKIRRNHTLYYRFLQLYLTFVDHFIKKGRNKIKKMFFFLLICTMLHCTNSNVQINLTVSILVSIKLKQVIQQLLYCYRT